MTYGLQIENPSGSIVLTTEGYGLNYVGKATYQSVTQASGSATTAPPGRTGGKVVYRITGCPDFPVVFHTIAASYKVGLLNIVTVGGGTYDLEFHCETGTYDTWNFGTQANAIEVFVFSRKTSLAGSYGMALYDSAGALAYDLSDRPLFPVEMKSFASVSASAVTIGTYTKPAFLGSFNAFQILETIVGGGPTYTQVTDRYGYTLTGTSLAVAALRRGYSTAVEQFVNDAGDGGSTVFVIEANPLP